jgi:hypothetical protein
VQERRNAVGRDRYTVQKVEWAGDAIGEFIGFLASGSDESHPDQHTSQEKLAEILAEDPVAFLAALTSVLATPDVPTRLLRFAIVIARSVLPATVPLHADPLAPFPPDHIAELLAHLLALFAHSSDQIRYHSAVSHGKFAAFHLKSQACSSCLDDILEFFKGAEAEEAALCAAISLDQIVSYISLGLSQKRQIFQATFEFLALSSPWNVAKAVCITFLSEFAADLPRLIGPNPEVFAATLLSLTECPLLATTAFRFWSEIVRTNPELVPIRLSDISLNFLANSEGTGLLLNVLDFWVSGASGSSASSSTKQTSPLIPKGYSASR